MQRQIAAPFEALEQPTPDGSYPAAASPSSSSHDDCMPFARNTYSGTTCLVHGAPHVQLAQQDGFEVEEIAGPSERAIPIKITLPKDLRHPPVAGRGPVFLMFRGLPQEITLSAGFRLRDAWAVSLRDVSNLLMSSPPGYQGSYMLTVTLHKGQNASPETRIIAVRLGLTAAQDGAARTAVQHTVATKPKVEPDSITASIAGKVERLSEGEEVTLLQNAAELLRNGDIEAARLVYSELAIHGSGKAAFLMAQTYDPQVLEEHFLVGMRPDSERARQWYSRAAELGDGDAKERLRILQRK